MKVYFHNVTFYGGVSLWRHIFMEAYFYGGIK